MASEGVVSPDEQMPQTTMAENGSGLPGLDDEQMTHLMGDYSDTPAINRPEFCGPSDVFQEDYGDFLKTEDLTPLVNADRLRSDPNDITTAADLARWMYGLSIGSVNLGRAPSAPPDRDIMGNLIPKLLPPDEALVFFERAGLKTVAGHIAANALPLAYALNEPGLSREVDAVPTSLKDVHTAVYRSMASALDIRDLTVPKDFGDALVRAGFEDIGRMLLKTLPPSIATDDTVNPLGEGLATKFPTLASKIAPIVKDALTLGAQGALGPDGSGKQALGGGLTGVTLRALSPFGRAAMRLAAAGIGRCDLFEDPEDVFQDYLRNVTLMTTFAGLGAAYGLTTKEAAAGTLYDWAKTKGFTPAEIAGSLKLNGIGPIANRFALEMGLRIAVDPGYMVESGEFEGPSVHQILQDFWNRYFTGGSDDSQTADPQEQDLSHLSTLDIYKQWAIGGIDNILRALWCAGHSGGPTPYVATRFRTSLQSGGPTPYEPYKSPFAPPANNNERTARLMGSFQLPGLLGVAAGAAGEAAGSLGGAAETANTVARSAVQLGQEGAVAESAGMPPGEWVTESIRPSARAYQAQITGRVGQAYLVNGVKFDGISDNALLEAKGPGYANFVKNGKFQDWFTGKDGLLDQAKNQMKAANGAPIEWHVADPEFVPVLRKLFEDEGLTGIKVIYRPALK